MSPAGRWAALDSLCPHQLSEATARKTQRLTHSPEATQPQGAEARFRPRGLTGRDERERHLVRWGQETLQKAAQTAHQSFGDSLVSVPLRCLHAPREVRNLGQWAIIITSVTLGGFRHHDSARFRILPTRQGLAVRPRASM